MPEQLIPSESPGKGGSSEDMQHATNAIKAFGLAREGTIPSRTRRGAPSHLTVGKGTTLNVASMLIRDIHFRDTHEHP